MIHIATRNKPLSLADASNSSPRYNLSSGVITPTAVSGKAWIESTDGKAATICLVNSNATEEMWLPGNTKTTVKGLDVDAFPANDKNRWPVFVDLLKNKPDDYTLVSLDADLLHKISLAISSDGGRQVHILVPKDLRVDEPLRVYGGNGIALLCQVVNGTENWQGVLDAYREDKLAVFKAGGDINRVIDAEKRSKELMDSL